jgi:endonuclease/exonuclease/phosphatase family metal-dependent hydrolase
VRIAFAFLLSGALLAGPAAAETTAWRLDGRLDDWPDRALHVPDPTGDPRRPAAGDQPGRDITALYARVEASALHVGLRFSTVEDGDEEPGLLLLIDADRDVDTGRRIGRLGAELVWDVGDRTGQIHVEGYEPPLDDDTTLRDFLGVLVAPTVTASTLELTLPRGLDRHDLFTGRAIHLAVVDERSGDRAPDDGSFTLVWPEEDEPVATIPLERAPQADLRLASYNVEHDGLFETDDDDRQAALRRLLSTIDPDVWVFNEVWDHDGEQVRARLGRLLDRDLSDWSAVRRDDGNVLLSRYPVRGSWTVIDDVDTEEDGHRITAALLDAPDREVLVIANHWRCCDADSMRQIEADGVIRFLRDARTAGGRIDLDEGTPIVLAGDFNLVRERQQLDTVMTGDVIDEARFGPDFAPDWDDTPLRDVPIRHVEQRFLHTWDVQGSRFGPGRLDWVFVSDSVVDTPRHYVLDTGRMSSATLQRYGLEARDARIASDHFPLVVDLRWK